MLGIIGPQRGGSGKTTVTLLLHMLQRQLRVDYQIDGMICGKSTSIICAHILGVVAAGQFSVLDRHHPQAIAASKPDAIFEDIVYAVTAGRAEEFLSEHRLCGYETPVQRGLPPSLGRGSASAWRSPVT